MRMPLQIHSTGLSALVEAQLGVPLDKFLQCSSWASRPLSQEQVSPMLKHVCMASLLTLPHCDQSALSAARVLAQQ